MAKRSRGSAHPGQLAPARRTQTQRAARPATPRPATPAPETPRPSGTLTEAEAARAAELEAQILAQERAAEQARDRARRKAKGGDLVAAGARGESLIAVTAGREYEYVRKDLRHIAIVCAALTGVLLVLWIVIEVLELIRL